MYIFSIAVVKVKKSNYINNASQDNVDLTYHINLFATGNSPNVIRYNEEGDVVRKYENIVVITVGLNHFIIRSV